MQRVKGQGYQEFCHPARLLPKVRHSEVSGIRGAVKQVTGGAVTRATRGTGRVSTYADPRSVQVEERAIARAELGQGGSLRVGKKEFLFRLEGDGSRGWGLCKAG